ncbi:hypothetical protein [Pseudomonas viridiflava]|uniref:hypothetical protein n=1 Tax=Pseudomonas viridiflava TaxID=33069 RepID=UPI000F018ECD|nr:hypothetical protein [Pseudomonas viridiflava]MEE4573155.1 hypothetical protein [Pseudomonas alliivorans]
MKTLKVTVHNGAWLDRPGTSTTFYLVKRNDGLRVSLLELEGLPPVAKLIEGDGRTKDFLVHAAGEL